MKIEEGEHRRFDNEIHFVTTHERIGNLERFQSVTVQDLVTVLSRI